jgi:hypothetical protein
MAPSRLHVSFHPICFVDIGIYYYFDEGFVCKTAIPAAELRPAALSDLLACEEISIKPSFRILISFLILFGSDECGFIVLALTDQRGTPQAASKRRSNIVALFL